jgi:5-deoxy-glucuronate isomerase
MTVTQGLNDQQLIFSGTAAHRGRKTSVFPGNSALQHLHYGRVLLDADVPKASFETGARETALLCMHGACNIDVDGARHALAQYDAIYIPRGCSVEVSTDAAVDLVECAAEVEGDYPLQLVPYSAVAQNPAQKFTAGGASTSRDLNIVIGDNVQAGRILMGFTKSLPGNWTSWPPHEHSELLEEVYVYFDMPAPAFGIQLVYTEPEKPEFVSIVRDGDAVLMPAGYHPNVAAPGHGINFIWMMAAHREVRDRKFGVVNVQPGFDQKGSGLEASQAAAAGNGR